jgi:F-type H+-transporting ATPase subunit b
MLDVHVPTIVFQMVNFLVLLVLLTKFLYQPVLRVMKEREEAIAARLRAADERGRQAAAERERLASLERDAEAKAERLLASARAEGQEEGKRLLDEARQEASRLLDEARRTVDEQERAALARVEAQVRETAVRMAASLIRRAAGPSVHRDLLERLLREGIRTNDTEADTVRRALADGPARITIEVAYPAEAETEARVREAIARDLRLPPGAADASVRVAPELVAGLRILAGEVVLDFSLRQTLRELQEGPGEQAEPEAT